MPRTPEAQEALRRKIEALKKQVAAAEAQQRADKQAQLVRTARTRSLFWSAFHLD